MAEEKALQAETLTIQQRIRNGLQTAAGLVIKAIPAIGFGTMCAGIGFGMLDASSAQTAVDLGLSASAAETFINAANTIHGIMPALNTIAAFVCGGNAIVSNMYPNTTHGFNRIAANFGINGAIAVGNLLAIKAANY